MEDNSILSSRLYNFQRLRYFTSHSKFFLRSRKNKQRLIPLTREIQEAMMDFNNDSLPSFSAEMSNNNTYIISLIRDEVNNILQDLFIRKENIGDIIEKCLKEKVTVIQDCDAKLQHIAFGDRNEGFEITVEEMNEEKDQNKLIVKNIKILEHRTTTLESRLNFVLQNISKSKYIKAKRFKINKNANIELLNTLYKKDKTPIRAENFQDRNTLSEAAVTNKEISCNIYNNLFYTARQYKLNLLNYKKSIETIKLNKKPKWNPYVKPATIVSIQLEEKFKKHKFLATDDICMA